MTETAKERIYLEALEKMSDSNFMGNKYGERTGGFGSTGEV